MVDDFPSKVRKYINYYSKSQSNNKLIKKISFLSRTETTITTIYPNRLSYRNTVLTYDGKSYAQFFFYS